jgi:hypothetical protein
MVTMGEAARQDDRRVPVGWKCIAVPEEVDWAPSRSIERSDRLSLAVGPRKLHNSDAGRASRHTNSVGAAGGRQCFS